MANGTSTIPSPEQTTLEPVGTSPPRGLVIALPAAIFLVTCLAFLPAVRNEFVSLDDHKNFLGNYHYRGLGLENVKWAWTTFHNGAYQPLSWILFSAQYVAWQLDAQGYHVVSVLLHAMNGALFYWLALRLLPLVLPVAARNHPVGLRWASALAALLFALHPLRAEAVAWLSTQPYLPVGMFYLLSLLAYLRACRSDGDTKRRFAWLAVSCVCYACSILSKGVGVTLVAVLVILDVYPLRRLWPGRRGGEPGPANWAVLAEKIPFLLLSVASALLAVWSKLEAMVPVGSYDIPHRIVQAAWGVMFYLRKTILPVDLSPWYQFPDGFSIWEPRFVVSVVLAIVVSAAAIWCWQRWRAGTALWAYYLIVLFPLSHLVRLGRQAAADRYTYVACMCWALLGGAGVLAAWHARVNGRMKPLTFNGIAAVSIAACAALGVLSWRQVQVWHDGVSLWQRAADVTPEVPIPHSNLSQELRMKGDLRGAMRAVQAAIDLDPNDPGPWINKAVILLDMGRPGLAIEQLQTALRLAPDHYLAHSNLGAIHLRQGRIDEAIASLKRTVEIRPDNDGAQCNLANALMRKKRYDEAIKHCKAVLDRVPDSAEARTLWGMALARKGDTKGGLEKLREALDIDAGCGSARINLARVLGRLKRHDQALSLLRAGVELNRPEPRVMAALAKFLLTCPDAKLRNPAQALTWAQQASRLDQGRNIDHIELIATALAANGAVDQAIVVGRHAMELARKQNQPERAQRIARQIASYQRRLDGVP